MKKFFIALISLALSMGASAQLLWKVTGNGAVTPSYLFGTHHVAPVSLLKQIKGFDQALQSVKAVYGEVDMSVMTDPQAMQAYATSMMAPADSTLSRVLSAADLAQLDAMIKNYTMGFANAAQFDQLRPAAVAAQLAMLINMKVFPGFNPTEQLDGTIQTLAAQAGKDIRGLETLEFQTGLLFGEPIAAQAESLIKTISHADRAESSAKELADAYLSGNLEAMSRLMADPEVGMDEAEAEKMIYQRNANWTEILTGVIPATAVFVAVGAGHLPGEKGLISLLRKAGFTVEPVE